MSLSLPFRSPDDAAHSPTKPSKANGLPRLSPSPSFIQTRSPSSSHTSVRRRSVDRIGAGTAPRRCKSQYPRDSPERHVEYILVASFHIDRGPIMEHQYPTPISGDESMLAELMLPDQTHVRSQDWTIFFLHKDTSADGDDDDSVSGKKKKKRKGKRKDQEHGEGDGTPTEVTEEVSEDDESSDDEEEGGEGPPLMYVLNLVNTKQDNTAKRYGSQSDSLDCVRLWVTDRSTVVRL